MKGQHGPGRLAQAPFCTIAHHRAADLAGGGEADADQVLAVAPLQGLDDDRALGLRRAFSGREKLGPLF